MMAPFYGTQEDFIKREISVWGIDYITDLFDKGYDAIETTAGWKWQMPALSNPTVTMSDRMPAGNISRV